jgi:hypothetical protein
MVASFGYLVTPDDISRTPAHTLKIFRRTPSRQAEIFWIEFGW